MVMGCGPSVRRPEPCSGDEVEGQPRVPLADLGERHGAAHVGVRAGSADDGQDVSRAGDAGLSVDLQSAVRQPRLDRSELARGAEDQLDRVEARFRPRETEQPGDAKQCRKGVVLTPDGAVPADAHAVKPGGRVAAPHRSPQQAITAPHRARQCRPMPRPEWDVIEGVASQTGTAPGVRTRSLLLGEQRRGQPRCGRLRVVRCGSESRSSEDGGFPRKGDSDLSRRRSHVVARLGIASSVGAGPAIGAHGGCPMGHPDRSRAGDGLCRVQVRIGSMSSSTIRSGSVSSTGSWVMSRRW